MTSEHDLYSQFTWEFGNKTSEENNKQVVYLPRIDKQELTTNQTLNRRQQHALCRITSPVRLETVQGEETDTEVIRVATVTFTEDV